MNKQDKYIDIIVNDLVSKTKRDGVFNYYITPFGTFNNLLGNSWTRSYDELISECRNERVRRRSKNFYTLFVKHLTSKYGVKGDQLIKSIWELYSKGVTNKISHSRKYPIKIL